MTRIPSKTMLSSTLAIATAMLVGTTPAGAQSFLGNVVSSSGNVVNIDQAVAGQTTVDLNPGQSVINWSATGNPSGGTIVFQPDGTSAVFQSSGDFAVLNRVDASGNSIYMGGSVTGLVGRGFGGTIFFSSADGIIIGQNAVINTGSLGLTTMAIGDDGNGNWMTGFGTSAPQVDFGPASNANSVIRIDPALDGNINAHGGSGNYIVLVAPRIEHRGIIRSDGSVGLVAAEAARVTFNDGGLWNIEMDAGTGDTSGVVVDGGTITRNSSLLGTNHRAYLTTLSKNDATSMLITNGASIGFDIAGSAAVENNVVVLSAGNDVLSGAAFAPSIPTGKTGAVINGAAISSDLRVEATGDVRLASDVAATTVDLNAYLVSATKIDVAATNNTLSIGGNLDAVANVDREILGGAATGGDVRVESFGQSLSIGGSAYLSAQGFGGDGPDNGIAGSDGTGGTIRIGSFDGGSLTIAGDLEAFADGHGGNQDYGGAAGGTGRGGTVEMLSTGANSHLTVTGSTKLSVTGLGGGATECSTCGVSGGDAFGGRAIIYADGDKANLVLGYTSLDASATGGTGDVVGGNAFGGGHDLVGGALVVATNGAAVSFRSDLSLSADAIGRSAFSSGAGGNGQAGLSSIQSSAGGAITIDGTTFASADGSGGDGLSGGKGTGGSVVMETIAGLLTLSGTQGSSVNLSAYGDGGQAEGSLGGEGKGGNVWVRSQNGGTLESNVFLNLDATGYGGGPRYGRSGNGAVGTGGSASMEALGGGHIVLNSAASLHASGYGGGITAPDSVAGEGKGGDVNWYASGTSSSIVAQGASLTANGYGGWASGDCNDCGGGGGNGLGGRINLYATGAESGGNSLTFADDLTLSAEGVGSGGWDGASGSGTGNFAQIFAEGFGSISMTYLDISADGFGADQLNGLAAGNGTGGEAVINLRDSGSVTVSGLTGVHADGLGGASTSGAAGSGTGGWSHIYGTAGTAEFQSDLLVSAQGMGGNSDTGLGGSGSGGRARMNSDGADFHVLGNAVLTVASVGGNGSTGGSALTQLFVNEANALFRARNGSVTVDGLAALDSSAVGGAGSTGAGGNATGGESAALAVGSATGNGILSLSTLVIDASATGGDGGAGASSATGGAGGDAQAGNIYVLTTNSDSGINSQVLGMAGLDGSATGGAGGAGGDGSSGGIGGNGGAAHGGDVQVLSSSGNGEIQADAVVVLSEIQGGAGGAGGVGTAGNGGNGGNGGLSDGSFIQIGSMSEAASLTSGGAASYGGVSISGASRGGDGGAGGAGTVQGLGGDGGDAAGTFVSILDRGSTVTMGSVLIDADIFGGNGGSGSTAGLGGDATTGRMSILSTYRYLVPTQGAVLTIGSYDAQAIATGGSGSTTGQTFIGLGVDLEALGSQLNLGSYSATIDGGTSFDPQYQADQLSIVDGDINVSGDFTLSTTGQLSVHIDGGDFATDGTASISAATFDVDRTLYPDLPAALGTIRAGTLGLATGGDLVMDANIDSGSPLTVDVPGRFQLGSVNAAGIDLTAGGTFNSGNLTSSGDLSVVAGGYVSAGTVSAPTGAVLFQSSGGSVTTLDLDAGSIELQGTSLSVGSVQSASFLHALTTTDFTSGDITTVDTVNIDVSGNISTGSITTPSDILLFAGGDIDVIDLQGSSIEMDAGGNLLAGAMVSDLYIDLAAGGSLTAGDLLAGEDISAVAQGPITLGNVSATLSPNVLGGIHNVGIASNSSIIVENIEALDSVGLASAGDLTGGNILAGGDAMALVGGNTVLGSVTTNSLGRFVVAGFDLFAQAGGTDAFDPNFVFQAIDSGSASAAGGSVTLTSVTTGGLDVLANGNITIGSISSDWFNLWSGQSIGLTDANADAGEAEANGLLSLGGDIAILNGLTLISNDIDVLTGANVTAGTLDLLSSNATGTLVGDGLTGGGYLLGSAEVGRLDAAVLRIGADTSRGAAASMRIGDLTYDAGGSPPSTVLEFLVGNRQTQQAQGTIRVEGDLLVTGVTDPDTEVGFASNRFLLDAGTGSVVVDNGGALGGTLYVNAQQVYVAEGAILDRILADPAYDGLIADLATPTSVSRPEGVLRASNIYVDLTDYGQLAQGGQSTQAVGDYAVYVQNSGTADDPAGFTANYAEALSPENDPSALIDLIVNGQIVGEGGTLTGVDVRDALMIDDDPGRFTTRSTINGCALVGDCGGPVQPPRPPYVPGGEIASEIVLFNDAGLGDALFGNEEAIEDSLEEGGEDGATSPIEPPVPLFDTRPLDPDQDSDEPVSGGGNPALMGQGSDRPLTGEGVNPPSDR